MASVASQVGALNTQRAVAAGFCGAAIMSVGGFVLDLAGLARQDLLSIAGVQSIAPALHTNRDAIGILGILIHLIVASFVVGIGFGMLRQRQHANVEWTGAFVGIGCWLLAQIVFIPILGFKIDPTPGFFSLGQGIANPIVSLILHVAFGLSLGAIYEPHHEVYE